MMSCFDYDPNRADYLHDQRKHCQEPEPVVLKPGPLSTAMDIALIVRGMSSLSEAGKLIEQWASWRAEAERMEAVRAGAGR